MEIKKVELSDLDAIIDIEKRYFSGFEFYSKQSLTDMLSNKDIIFIKAVKDKKIVGYLIAYFLTDHLDLYQIATHYDFKRQKVATELEAQLLKYNLPIYIEVSQLNEGAIAFYKSKGYKIIKILNNYYECGSALLMRK